MCDGDGDIFFLCIIGVDSVRVLIVVFGINSDDNFIVSVSCCVCCWMCYCIIVDNICSVVIFCFKWIVCWFVDVWCDNCRCFNVFCNYGWWRRWWWYIGVNCKDDIVIVVILLFYCFGFIVFGKIDYQLQCLCIFRCFRVNCFYQIIVVE